MPRFDRTGPNSAGAKTGCQNGVCNNTQAINQPINRPGFGRGNSGRNSFTTNEAEREYLERRLKEIENISNNK